MLSHFYTIPERDGRTDRRTDGQTDGRIERISIAISRVSVLTCDKNVFLHLCTAKCVRLRLSADVNFNFVDAEMWMTTKKTAKTRNLVHKICPEKQISCYSFYEIFSIYTRLHCVSKMSQV